MLTPTHPVHIPSQCVRPANHELASKPDHQVCLILGEKSPTKQKDNDESPQKRGNIKRYIKRGSQDTRLPVTWGDIKSLTALAQ